jgi:hypothetical protein
VTAKPQPIIFLDVDGVLNRLSDPHVDNPDFFKFEPVQYVMEGNGWQMVQGFPLRLSKEMVRELLAITTDIRWATSWTSFNDYANPCIGPLIDMPYLPTPMLDIQQRFGCGPTSAKIRVVEDELKNPGPPVIWIDDDVADPGAVADPHFRLIAVAPECDLGITRSDIARIKQFIAEKESA